MSRFGGFGGGIRKISGSFLEVRREILTTAGWQEK
jgi:hypothetical protein